MIVNVNARTLGNGAVFVQYQEGGKSKDAAFLNWEEFIEWFTKKVKEPSEIQ